MTYSEIPFFLFQYVNTHGQVLQSSHGLGPNIRQIFIHTNTTTISIVALFIVNIPENLLEFHLCRPLYESVTVAVGSGVWGTLVLKRWTKTFTSLRLFKIYKCCVVMNQHVKSPRPPLALPPPCGVWTYCACVKPHGIKYGFHEVLSLLCTL